MTGEARVQRALLGGPRHGEEVWVDEDAPTFYDLRSGTTYEIRDFARAPISPITGQQDLERAIGRFTFVHESITDLPTGWAALHDYLAGKWVTDGGGTPAEQRELATRMKARLAAERAAASTDLPASHGGGIILNGKATP